MPRSVSCAAPTPCALMRLIAIDSFCDISCLDCPYSAAISASVIGLGKWHPNLRSNTSLCLSFNSSMATSTDATSLFNLSEKSRPEAEYLPDRRSCRNSPNFLMLFLPQFLYRNRWDGLNPLTSARVRNPCFLKTLISRGDIGRFSITQFSA